MAKETITSGAGVLWSAIVTMLNNMFTEVYSRLFPAQAAELTPVQLVAVTPKTSGKPTFEIGTNSFSNLGAGAGTYNQGLWVGFNSGRHSTLPVTDSKHALIMGFEDNFFDSSGDLKYGAEWYVEGWSPDGTTVSMSRPFFCRGLQEDDGNDWWTIVNNIGASGTNRQMTVKAGTETLMNITPIHVDYYKPTEFHDGFNLSAGNFQIANNLYFQMYNSAGAVCSVMVLSGNNTLYIGDIFNTTTGNVHLRGGGANRVNCNATGLSFNDVAPIAKPLLATGAGATVDDVITVLQNLGLVKQS